MTAANCLGDLSADVAMTKRGFGEMAITGTMAGPIFNVLMGMGLGMVLKFAKSDLLILITCFVFN